MTDIFFATNRAPIADGTNTTVDFGPGFNRLGVTFGKAAVPNPNAATVVLGQLFPLTGLQGITFDTTFQAQMTAAAVDHLLISVHGFDYTFQESILRLANLSAWFGDDNGAKPVKATVIGFCWPSAGELDPIDYEDDYKRAGQSGDAFRIFLKAMESIIGEYRKTPNRRVSLLAHSMGHHALSAGLYSAIGTGVGQYDPTGKDPLFDQTILAAGDEDTDALSHADKLGTLLQLSRRVHLYYNNQDLALGIASRALHLASRLGIDGPNDKPAFVGKNCSFVNCSTANPYWPNGERVDPEWHQYYHVVPEVRDDICAMMAGLSDDDPQVKNRSFRADLNYYRLDLNGASQRYGYLISSPVVGPVAGHH